MSEQTSEGDRLADAAEAVVKMFTPHLPVGTIGEKLLEDLRQAVSGYRQLAQGGGGRGAGP